MHTRPGLASRAAIALTIAGWGTIAAAAPPPPPPPPPLPKAAAERVLSTGVLDLDLIERGSLFVIRDDAYQVTFPMRPKVEAADQPAPSGITLKTASALAYNDSDVYGFFLIPIPRGQPYDVDKGLTGARDGALGNIHAKLLKEVPITFGGLKGRKATGAAVIEGKNLTIDLYLAYDKDHHTVVGLFAASTQAVAPRAAAAFIASFKANRDGKAPPAGTGK